LDAIIVFLEQCGNHISLLVWFTKHQQLARQIGDSRALLFVEKEAMAPHTVGELASRMAHGGHIHRKNYELISIKGPAPAFARGYNPNLCHGDPRHVARSGLTLGTTSDGSILEFTYLEAPVPSLIADRDQASHLGNQRSTARNKFIWGMASSGHIPLRNYAIDHLRGPAPAFAFSCGTDLCPRGLSPVTHGGHILGTP
jgi:hypothetical protein